LTATAAQIDDVAAVLVTLTATAAQIDEVAAQARLC